MKTSTVVEAGDRELNKSALQSRLPVVFRTQKLGPCLEKWHSSDYLASCLHGVNMSVHVCKSDVQQLNFVGEKNFTYQTLPGQELIKRVFEKEHDHFFIEKKERYYLRSLGTNIRKEVADIRRQFEFADRDINWNLFANVFDDSLYFSSILRIASPSLGIWTHYDCCDNFLFQVVGERFVTLYSPQFADQAYLKGDKSAVVNPYDYDAEKYPKFCNIELLTCTLKPGDVLFIPALWFHHISMGLSPSVGVNVFWRSPLKSEMYSPNDLYGNRDPIPAEQALALAGKIEKLLEKLPPDHADFYAKRICQQLTKSKPGQA